jgi:hypothetical protein
MDRHNEMKIPTKVGRFHIPQPATSRAQQQIVSFDFSNDTDDTFRNSACKEFLIPIKHPLSSIQNYVFRKIVGVIRHFVTKGSQFGNWPFCVMKKLITTVIS